METIFLHYLYSTPWLIYVVVFIGIILEGEVVLFAAFYFTHQGHLKLGTLLLVVAFGAIIGDILWYKFGVYLEKFVFIRKHAHKITKSLDERLRKRPLSTLFIARFTYGIYHATLIRAGAIKVRFLSYLRMVFFSGIIWISLIGGLAYFSSVSVILLKKYIKYGELGLLLGVVFLFIFSHIISKIGKKEIIELNENNK